MKSREKLRRYATIIGLLYILLLDPVTAAPVTVEESEYEVDGGCYYMLDVYQNGEQIRTNEPCLNCTCAGTRLMCYLQTCPFSKPIGKECSVERANGQCCPIIKCPEVPVMIPDPLLYDPPVTALAAATTVAPTVAPLSDPEEGSGCYIDDTYYYEGSRVPEAGGDPCDLCYCIHNRTACVKQQCLLEIPGCRPKHQPGACCPIAYSCDNSVTFTPPTTTTTTTTALPPSGCYVDDEYYYDGSIVHTGGPCEHCYCMQGKLVCAVQECDPPVQDCAPVYGRDQCCPERYECPVTEVPKIRVTVDALVPKTTLGPSNADDVQGPLTTVSDLENKITTSIGPGPAVEVMTIVDLLTTEGTKPSTPEPSEVREGESSESIVALGHSTSGPAFQPDSAMTTSQASLAAVDRDSGYVEQDSTSVAPDASTSLPPEDGTADDDERDQTEGSLLPLSSTEPSADGPSGSSGSKFSPEVTEADDYPATSAVLPQSDARNETRNGTGIELVSTTVPSDATELPPDTSSTRLPSLSGDDLPVSPEISSESPTDDTLQDEPSSEGPLLPDSGTPAVNDRTNAPDQSTQAPVQDVRTSEVPNDDSVATDSSELPRDEVVSDEPLEDATSQDVGSSELPQRIPESSKEQMQSTPPATTDPGLSVTAGPTADNRSSSAGASAQSLEVSSEVTIADSTPGAPVDNSTSEAPVGDDPSAASSGYGPSEAPVDVSASDVPSTDVPERTPSEGSPSVISSSDSAADVPTEVPPVDIPTRSVAPYDDDPSEATSSGSATESEPGHVPSEAPSNDDASEAPSDDLPSVAPSGDNASDTPSRDGPSEAPSGDVPAVTPPSLIASEAPSSDHASEAASGDIASDAPSRADPTEAPSSDSASDAPSGDTPSEAPSSDVPSVAPSSHNTSEAPSGNDPSEAPSDNVSSEAPSSDDPTEAPSVAPSRDSTSEAPLGDVPSGAPSSHSTSEAPSGDDPSEVPSDNVPSEAPSGDRTEAPSGDVPSTAPSGHSASETPSGDFPTETPSGNVPSEAPSLDSASEAPSSHSTEAPSGDEPSEAPSSHSTEAPSGDEPSEAPSSYSTEAPSGDEPSEVPTSAVPSVSASGDVPSAAPSSHSASEAPSGGDPTEAPSSHSTEAPSVDDPSEAPSGIVPSEASSSDSASDAPSSDVPSEAPSIHSTSEVPSGVDPTETPYGDVPSEGPSRAPSIHSTSAAPSGDHPSAVTSDHIPSEAPSSDSVTLVPGDGIASPDPSDVGTSMAPLNPELPESSPTSEKGRPELATTLSSLVSPSPDPRPSQAPAYPPPELPETTESAAHSEIPDLGVQAQSTTELGSESRTTPPRDPEVTTVAVPETTAPSQVQEDPATLPPADIPGEGDCQQDGVTYRTGAHLPSKDPCLENCTCRNSLVQCSKVRCSVPDLVRNMTCTEIFEVGRCCPRYVCHEQSTASQEPIAAGSLVTEATTEKETGGPSEVPLHQLTTERQLAADRGTTLSGSAVGVDEPTYTTQADVTRDRTNQPPTRAAADSSTALPAEEVLEQRTTEQPELLSQTAADGVPATVGVVAHTSPPSDATMAQEDGTGLSDPSKVVTRSPADGPFTTEEVESSTGIVEHQSELPTASVTTSRATVEDEVASTTLGLEQRQPSTPATDDPGTQKPDADVEPASAPEGTEAPTSGTEVESSTSASGQQEERVATDPSLDVDVTEQEVTPADGAVVLGTSGRPEEPSTEVHGLGVASAGSQDEPVATEVSSLPSMVSALDTSGAGAADGLPELTTVYQVYGDDHHPAPTTHLSIEVKVSEDITSTQRPLVPDEAGFTEQGDIQRTVPPEVPDADEPQSDEVDSEGPIVDTSSPAPSAEELLRTQAPAEEPPGLDSSAKPVVEDLAGAEEELVRTEAIAVATHTLTTSSIPEDFPLRSFTAEVPLDVAVSHTTSPPPLDIQELASDRPNETVSELRPLPSTTVPPTTQQAIVIVTALAPVATSPTVDVVSDRATHGPLPATLFPEIASTPPAVPITASEGHGTKEHPTHTSTEPYGEQPEDLFPDVGIPITSENFTLEEGECIYESRIYGSAQQIPRDDPCDFCFCFRGDIICLQQSCPPPIKGCNEETIPGFCCPRYECPVTAVTLNLTDTKVPYPVSASRYRTVRALTQVQVVVCEFQNKFYSKGESILAASGPCMDCVCGERGTMKCIPKKCQLDPFWQSLPVLKRLGNGGPRHVTNRDGRNRF